MGSVNKAAPRRRVDGIAEKQCTRCSEFLAETDENFYRMGGKLHSMCKQCFCDYVRERRIARADPPELPPEVEPRAEATFAAGLRIVERFRDAWRPLSILTWGWGKTPTTE
jgi:hypothetical protein